VNLGDVDRLRAEMRAHPCHACPDRDEHARWAERYFRALRDRDRLAGEISRETGSIARIFDRRLEVLSELGYLTSPSGKADALDATTWGTLLRTVYSENDLVIAECLRAGIWNSLPAPALAAVVSSLVYEGRREDEGRTPRIPQGPQGPIGVALTETLRIWTRIDEMGTERRLGRLQTPHWGIVGPVHAWAQGKSLDAVLQTSELAAGDLVRWFKQVIDVLDQVAEVAPDGTVRKRAEQAIDAIRRGIVAY
jgi:ATP-dependent RNA helicase HelY